jgi:N-methylhydantoinase B
VSAQSARDDYGVVMGDSEATARLRSASRGERPFFDRGPGYERLAG